MAGLPAVVGVADHSGWAILVTVGAPDGQVRILDRRRSRLLDEGLPGQPFHHVAANLTLEEAEALVARVRASATKHAKSVMNAIRSDVTPDFDLTAMTVRKGPARPIPETVAGIIASHPAMHAADGELFRRAFCDAAEAIGIEARRHPRKTEYESAATALGLGGDDAGKWLDAIGKPLGPPWQKDHKNATAAALAVLGERAQLSAVA